MTDAKLAKWEYYTNDSIFFFVLFITDVEGIIYWVTDIGEFLQPN